MTAWSPVQISWAVHGSGRSQSIRRRSVQGVRPPISPTASRMSLTEISSGFRLSTKPPPGPRTERMTPAFFSL